MRVAAQKKDWPLDCINIKYHHYKWAHGEKTRSLHFCSLNLGYGGVEATGKRWGPPVVNLGEHPEDQSGD